jgi:hypothetical protein
VCRASQRLGGLLVRQVRPGDQEQQVTVGGRQALQRRRDAGAEEFGGHPCVAAVGERPAHALGGGAGEQLGTAFLDPAVLADEVGRDAVQPGPGVRPGQVVLSTVAKGDREGLGTDVLGRLGTEPCRDIAVDLVPVPVEDIGEPLRVGERRADALAVAHLTGVRMRVCIDHHQPVLLVRAVRVGSSGTWCDRTWRFPVFPRL